MSVSIVIYRTNFRFSRKYNQQRSSTILQQQQSNNSNATQTSEHSNQLSNQKIQNLTTAATSKCSVDKNTFSHSMLTVDKKIPENNTVNLQNNNRNALNCDKRKYHPKNKKNYKNNGLSFQNLNSQQNYPVQGSSSLNVHSVHTTCESKNRFVNKKQLRFFVFD